MKFHEMPVDADGQWLSWVGQTAQCRRVSVMNMMECLLVFDTLKAVRGTVGAWNVVEWSRGSFHEQFSAILHTNRCKNGSTLQ